MLRVVFGRTHRVQRVFIRRPGKIQCILADINTNNDREYTFEIYQKNILDRFSEIIPIIEPLPLENYTYLHNAYWYKASND